MKCASRRVVSSLVGLSTFISLSLGQGTTTSQPKSTATTTLSAAPQTHTVNAGNGDHKYYPDITQANVGDIVEFRFFPPNHSVVRADTTQYPCIPYEMTGKDKKGFFSGFFPVDVILPDPPKWQLLINDTSPIFFYCSAPGSCIDYTMVGVINPNASTSLARQKQLASDSAYMLQPGEPFPLEASTSPSSSPTSSLTPQRPPSSSSSSSTHGLTPGIIAAIVIASLSVITLAALLFFFIGRSRTLKQEADRKHSTIRHTSPTSPTFASPPMYQRRSSGVPPEYFPTVWKGSGGGGGVARAASHRSMGGTFDVGPGGVYTRTHEADGGGGGGAETQSQTPAWAGGWYAGGNGRVASPGLSPQQQQQQQATGYFDVQQNAGNGPVEADGREIGREF
ncbi:hypothetical protein EJ04DRAFT_552600 [Polyplosphaeria fusca]|uniref:Extracellular serine-rich protein n=1 Tax=Polyplosphaeria fusca TaxID=682080 RepID=A0A9P4R0M6_9PLEO|nr:hypothetical protein EJ04DRAFT_552600 [Polyplosphaeria fusca]